MHFVSILLEGMVMFLRDGVTTDDVGTKPGTSDISDTFVGSAGFVDFYSHSLPSFHVGINSNFTAQCVST